ncbi:MAG: hypothetical protein AAGE01_04240 [Pseudomonadota bacterium]
MFLFLGLWVVPVVLVLTARRVRGVQKAQWLLVTLAGSWAGWLLYSMFAPRLGDYVIDEYGHRREDMPAPNGKDRAARTQSLP